MGVLHREASSRIYLHSGEILHGMVFKLDLDRWEKALSEERGNSEVPTIESFIPPDYAWRHTRNQGS